MNKSYKTIYNTRTQTWVAVSEITTAQGKVKSSRSGEGAGSVARLTLSAIAASVLWMTSGTAMAADAYCAGTATQTYSAAGDQVVCGQGATATGYGDVAVGVGAQAAGNGSADNFGGATSLGSYSFASGAQAVALGARARAEEVQSIAIGNDTRATGTGSVSIGGDDSGSAYSTATFTVPGYTSGRTTYRATYSAGDGSTAIAPHAQALTKGSGVLFSPNPYTFTPSVSSRITSGVKSASLDTITNPSRLRA